MSPVAGTSVTRPILAPFTAAVPPVATVVPESERATGAKNKVTYTTSSTPVGSTFSHHGPNYHSIEWGTPTFVSVAATSHTSSPPTSTTIDHEYIKPEDAVVAAAVLHPALRGPLMSTTTCDAGAIHLESHDKYHGSPPTSSGSPLVRSMDLSVHPVGRPPGKYKTVLNTSFKKITEGVAGGVPVGASSLATSPSAPDSKHPIAYSPIRRETVTTLSTSRATGTRGDSLVLASKRNPGAKDHGKSPLGYGGATDRPDSVSPASGVSHVTTTTHLRTKPVR